jgi:hypothetical protein
MKKRATETNPLMASLIGPIKLVGLYSCRFGRVFGQRDAFRFHVAASRFQLAQKIPPASRSRLGQSKRRAARNSSSREVKKKPTRAGSGGHTRTLPVARYAPESERFPQLVLRAPPRPRGRAAARGAPRVARRA